MPVDDDEEEYCDEYQSNYSYDQENTQPPHQLSPAVVTKTKPTVQKNDKKKRGRPSTKKDYRQWKDEETEVLIEIWAGYDNLYNTKLETFHNREMRQKSLEEIEKELKDSKNIVADPKQIGKKLSDLKNYYGAQRRLVESSKSSGAGTDQVYVSNWKFFDQLNFLNDSFTPRQTKNRSK